MEPLKTLEPVHIFKLLKEMPFDEYKHIIWYRLGTNRQKKDRMVKPYTFQTIFFQMSLSGYENQLRMTPIVEQILAQLRTDLEK